MWYEKSYRRHLCDMHIDDWNDEFLSQLNAEDYCEKVINAGFQSAMVYFQSHVGYCYYPTKTGIMHHAFKRKEDTIKNIINTFRSNGISVVGYYSLVFNNVEHDRHPEWRLVSNDGMTARSRLINEKSEFTFSEASSTRYGLCCPNNPEYRDFVISQIKEISEYATVDGMFFDMTYWADICYCDECKKRWKREVGSDILINPPKLSDEWRFMLKKRREWIDEFAALITAATKEMMPGVTVAHNVAYSALNAMEKCNSVGVHKACDYSGGDLAVTPYMQSFTCKFFRKISTNQPFEFMFSRCEPSLAKHTTLKSKDIMASSLFLTAAHHGATLVIDAIDPPGTLDPKVYEQFKDVFNIEKQYEKHLTGSPVSDIGVYYSINGRYNLYNENSSNYSGITNLIQTFIEGNILSDITGIFDETDLSGYKMIFAPQLTEEDEIDNNRLAEYVKNGGILYLSGADNKKLTENLLGGKISGVTKEIITYMSPKKYTELFEYFSAEYPLNFDSSAAIIEGIDSKDVWATITLPYTAQNDIKFSSIHSNPPGIYTDIPALVVKKYGNGTVIWSAQPIESAPFEIYRMIVRNIVIKLIGECNLTISSDAPKNVEITVFQSENHLTVNTVHLNTDYYAEKIRPFELKVLCKDKPASVVLLPYEKEIDYTYDGKYVSFKTRELNIFDMYKITF